MLEIEGAPGNSVTVPADQSLEIRVYISAGPDQPAAKAGRTDLRIWVQDLQNDSRAYQDTSFTGNDTE